MLGIENVTYRIAGREILKGASANLPAGRRVGVVGRNGAGKTTLFKLIQGQLQTDAGEISKRWNDAPGLQLRKKTGGESRVLAEFNEAHGFF